MVAPHLGQLAAELKRLSEETLDLSYQVVPPFPEPALVVSRSDEQPVVVVPVWIANGHVKRYRTGPGVPHWQIFFGRSPLGADAHRLAHTLEEAASYILQWWQHPPPIERLPLGTDDLRKLRQIAAARGQVRATAAKARTSGVPLGAALNVSMELDERDDWPDPVRERLRAALARLDLERLLLNLPRPAGRAAAGTAVLLERLEQGAETLQSRHTWLVARVERGGRLRLTHEPLIGSNHPHRWDRTPWLWSTSDEADEATRWGVSDLPVHAMGLAGRTATIAHLTGLTGDPQRAAASVLLLDDDRVEEALDVMGIETSARLGAILAGTPAGRDCFLGEHVPRAVRDVLRGSAPWRFRATLEAGDLVRNRAGRLRIVALPNQRQQRKASLVLTAGSGGPLLDVDDTASNARLPEPQWKRPLDLDLRRFGLE